MLLFVCAFCRQKNKHIFPSEQEKVCHSSISHYTRSALLSIFGGKINGDLNWKCRGMDLHMEVLSVRNHNWNRKKPCKIHFFRNTEKNLVTLGWIENKWKWSLSSFLFFLYFFVFKPPSFVYFHPLTVMMCNCNINVKGKGMCKITNKMFFSFLIFFHMILDYQGL